jgi:hypothetical protein
MWYVIGAATLMAVILVLSEYLERRRKRRVARMRDVIEFRNDVKPWRDCL